MAGVGSQGNSVTARVLHPKGSRHLPLEPLLPAPCVWSGSGSACLFSWWKRVWLLHCQCFPALNPGTRGSERRLALCGFGVWDEWPVTYSHHQSGTQSSSSHCLPPVPSPLTTEGLMALLSQNIQSLGHTVRSLSRWASSTNFLP